MGKFARKERIGILGGTFDPIHMGHLMLAETAREILHLDKVIFIPARHPPHKKRAHLTVSRLRYKMVKLAIAGNKFFSVSRIEIDKTGISYSVETLKKLRKIYAPAEFYFLVGSDALPELKTWKNIQEIFKLCKFVIAKRPDFEKYHLPKGAFLLAGTFLNISSTQIRDLIKKGKSVRYLLPAQVCQLIQKHSLYQ